VPPDFGGASEKCQGKFLNFVTPWGKKNGMTFFRYKFNFLFN
jgi:hypothetical protein